MISEVIDVEVLLVKLSAILGASFLIERFLVLISELINKLFIIQSSTDYGRIALLRHRLELDKRASQEDALLLDPHLRDDDPREILPNPALGLTGQRESSFDVLRICSPDEVTNPETRFKILRKINSIRKEFWMQVFGTSIAIVVCYYSKFSIWIFEPSAGSSLADPDLWSALFTGVIIGGGSKPINFLMQFLINRKLEVAREEVKKEAVEQMQSAENNVTATTAGPPVSPRPPSMADYLGFTYRGGDRPERLENTHLFTGPVDLIVYHHTAMHSDAPYEALVKEFDRKGWLTGYNCVVFKDGTIRALCRWDRFGNHAVPHNGHSLGIAMQGNFEINPDVPYANHDGRYGLIAPTVEQVDATARVTALWTLMHQVPVSFPAKATRAPKGIVPHHLLANKACPGNNFPYVAFEQKVRHYIKTWQDDPQFDQALQEFKHIPFVFPTKSTE